MKVLVTQLLYKGIASGVLHATQAKSEEKLAELGERTQDPF